MVTSLHPLTDWTLVNFLLRGCRFTFVPDPLVSLIQLYWFSFYLCISPNYSYECFHQRKKDHSPLSAR